MLQPPCLLRGFHDTPRRRHCRAGLSKPYPAARGPNRGEVRWRTSELVPAKEWPEVCSGSALIASTRQLRVRTYGCREYRSAHARDKTPPLVGGGPLPALRGGDGGTP